MSVDVLRRAAALMRDNAEQATPGPWFRHGSGDNTEVRQSHPDLRGGRFNQVAACNGWETEDRDEENAEYIASLHPAVALAVADWLDVTAEHIASHECEAECAPAGCPSVLAALAVANAYLASGEQVSS